MNTLTLIGNLVAEPELRYINSGAAVVNFTVAQTPRIYNKATNEWTDGEALFMRCSLWREAAENVTQSLHKGTRVIVTGKLKQRSYEKDGDKRTAVELEVEEIGPSLKYATVEVTKTGRTGGGSKPAAGADGWADTSDSPF